MRVQKINRRKQIENISMLVGGVGFAGAVILYLKYINVIVEFFLQ